MENGERIQIHERLTRIETLLKVVIENQATSEKKMDSQNVRVDRTYRRVRIHEAVIGVIVVLVGLIFGAIKAYATLAGMFN